MSFVEIFMVGTGGRSEPQNRSARRRYSRAAARRFGPPRRLFLSL
jgi:hypothetical protein